MNRDRLEDRRSSHNATIEFKGERYDLTVGYYDDGRIGEVFINRIRDRSAAKLGEHLEATCRDAALILSVLLQHRGSVVELKHSITRDETGEPMSIMGAVVDYLARPLPPASDPSWANPRPRQPSPTPSAVVLEPA